MRSKYQASAERIPAFHAGSINCRLVTTDDKTTVGKFLFFKDEGCTSFRSKTHTFGVWSKISALRLGEVKWKNAWRKYALFPDGETCFDNECLADIIEFCELKNIERRLSWKGQQ